MSILEITICFLSIMLNVLCMSYCYKKLNNVRKIFGLIYCLLVVILSLIVFVVNYYIVFKYRIILFCLAMVIFYKLVYKDKLSDVIIKTLSIYLVVFIVDFLVSLLLIIIFNGGVVDVSYVNYVKAFSTFLVSMCLFLIFTYTKINNLIIKLYKLIKNKNEIFSFILLLMGFVVISIITYNNASDLKMKNFIPSLCVILFILIISIVMIYQYFKTKTAEKEQKQLLELMEEYENLLETGRENRHEMLNNLIVLKTEKNKASEKYEELLDDIIRQYQSKKSTNYSSLYKLPSGIKGIVYYKMANIKDNEITFTSVISDEMYKLFDEMDTKLYYKVCKITGILIDNAIEASTVSDDKLLLVDIYKENNLINIYIENTFEGNVDIDLINKKGFSTKGKNRGLGLHIVSTILRENDNLSLEQRVVNNKFVSILKIKL